MTQASSRLSCGIAGHWRPTKRPPGATHTRRSEAGEFVGAVLQRDPRSPEQAQTQQACRAIARNEHSCARRGWSFVQAQSPQVSGAIPTSQQIVLAFRWDGIAEKEGKDRILRVLPLRSLRSLAANHLVLLRSTPNGIRVSKSRHDRQDAYPTLAPSMVAGPSESHPRRPRGPATNTRASRSCGTFGDASLVERQ